MASSLNLSDNEKRDIIKFLEQGKPLPEKYRFLLFNDDREVELLWNGKTNEVTNVVLPFQVIEQIDEPRNDAKFGLQNSLFDFSGRQITGWTNKLIWGDNKLILSSLKNGPLRKEIEAQGGLKLIYIDPPFDVGADFSMNIEIGEDSFIKKPSVIEEIAYRDTWGKGADSFIAMIYERLKLMHDLLSEDGSIYIHCDWRVSAFMKLALDEAFGKDNFQREIIWSIETSSGFKTQADNWVRGHDTIYFYSKSSNAIFNKQFLPLDEGTIKRYDKADESGNKYKVYYNEDGSERRVYLDKSKGRPLTDTWTDIIGFQTVQTGENLYYPTQKPEMMLERIIKASSNEGDLVADFFCGSGTTLAVAEKLNRKWIGSDLGKFGIHTTRKRLIGIQRELKEKGINFRPFEILNVGKYERDSYLTTNDDLRVEERQKQSERKEKEFVKLIITAYKAEPVESFINIVAKKRDRLIAVGPINTPVSSKFIQQVVNECKDKNLTKIDILGFDYEMGMNIEEYRSQGIDIVFKVIPREVFDKQAVEKGQVKFYDVAYIEARPIIKGGAKSKELSIELTDFSVFYNQDSNDEVSESLRPGGTKVVVENGQVVKLTKDKESEVVSKEVLTKKWSDWIDYWAVDYNFSDRKEIIVDQDENGEYIEAWTGDYIFDNEWQSFRTKKNRNLELTSTPKEMIKGNYKIAIKIVDIFGNDTTKVVEVKI